MPFLLIPSLGWLRVPLALPRDGQAEAEEKEWQALEANARFDYGQHCRPKIVNKPHPESYRPDIPLRLTTSYKALCTLTKDEKAALAGREIVWRPIQAGR